LEKSVWRDNPDRGKFICLCICPNTGFATLTSLTNKFREIFHDQACHAKRIFTRQQIRNALEKRTEQGAEVIALFGTIWKCISPTSSTSSDIETRKSSS